MYNFKGLLIQFALRQFIILLLILGICISGYSTPITKVLVIDSVIGVTDKIDILINTPFDTSLFEDFVKMDSLTTHHRVEENYIVKIHPVSINDSNPSVVFVLSAEDNESIIQLPLDDSGGTMSLKGCFLTHGDTIHISRLNVFHNCLPDTIKCGKWWYKNYNADTTRELKLLRSRYKRPKAVIKENNCKWPDSVFLSINGKEVVTEVKAKYSSAEVTWYCGGHRKMRVSNERRYDRRKMNGKPYKYFSVCSRKYKYSLHAEISMP